MTTGVGKVLVCEPVASQIGGVHDTLCPPAGAQFFQVTTHEALVLDPGLLAAFEAPSAEDIGLAFGVTFTVTVSLWLAAKGFGSLLLFIRAHR